MFYTEVSLAIGSLFLFEENQKLVQIHFENSSVLPMLVQISEKANTPLLLQSTKELSEYFQGTRTEFTMDFDPEGSPFQKKAWKALMGIPYGSTISYYEQSLSLGNSHYARAVGQANRRNPLPIVIPCHRVISKLGRLQGYALGLSIKKYLIELEGTFFKKET